MTNEQTSSYMRTFKSAEQHTIDSFTLTVMFLLMLTAFSAGYYSGSSAPQKQGASQSQNEPCYGRFGRMP